MELAKKGGLTVTADAPESDWDLVSSLGADIIVPRGVNVVERIKEHFPEGVDGLADILPLARDAEAHHRLEASGTGGRLVLGFG